MFFFYKCDFLFLKVKSLIYKLKMHQKILTITLSHFPLIQRIKLNCNCIGCRFCKTEFHIFNALYFNFILGKSHICFCRKLRKVLYVFILLLVSFYYLFVLKGDPEPTKEQGLNNHYYITLSFLYYLLLQCL